MASQEISIVVVAGIAADAVRKSLEELGVPGQNSAAASRVDDWCRRVLESRQDAPVLFYSSWIDYWSMGDVVPGPSPIEGRAFQVATFSAEGAIEWARQINIQYPEDQWFAGQLVFAADAFRLIVPDRIVIVIRNVIGGFQTDEEILGRLSIPWNLS